MNKACSRKVGKFSPRKCQHLHNLAVTTRMTNAWELCDSAMKPATKKKNIWHAFAGVQACWYDLESMNGLDYWANGTDDDLMIIAAVNSGDSCGVATCPDTLVGLLNVRKLTPTCLCRKVRKSNVCGGANQFIHMCKKKHKTWSVHMYDDGYFSQQSTSTTAVCTSLSWLYQATSGLSLHTLVCTNLYKTSKIQILGCNIVIYMYIYIHSNGWCFPGTQSGIPSVDMHYIRVIKGFKHELHT